MTRDEIAMVVAGMGVRAALAGIIGAANRPSGFRGYVVPPEELNAAKAELEAYDRTARALGYDPTEFPAR